MIRWLEPCGDDAVGDAGVGELCAGLAYQLTPVNEDQYAPATGCSGLGDGGQDDGFASSCGRHQQRRVGTAAIGHAQIADGLLLVGAEVHSDSSSCVPSAGAPCMAI